MAKLFPQHKAEIGGIALGFAQVGDLGELVELGTGEAFQFACLGQPRQFQLGKNIAPQRNKADDGGQPPRPITGLVRLLERLDVTNDRREVECKTNKCLGAVL